VAVVVSAVSARADVFNMGGTISGGTWTGLASLQFVTVGDPGNVGEQSRLVYGDTNYYGAVPYTFNMGKYDVTLAQYTAFLNAVAKTDTYGLYNSGMGSDFSTQGISQTGSPGSYSYSVTGSNPRAANCPAFDVTWGDAARFCNWLDNGQGTAANVAQAYALAEAGAYALNGGTSNTQLMAAPTPAHSGSGAAKYFLPTENEWYKAAYYVGGGTNAGYWTYPTQSNTAPSNSLALAGTLANDANYENGGYTDPTNYLTSVGTFAASPGPYGTFDMGGDLWQ
jgi:sulfatase modifying factor 1